jgi:hypothetical protein
MKNMRKWLPMLLLVGALFSFGANPAAAWYMELTDVVGAIEVGTYYTQKIYFHSDTGTDNLADFFLSVDYDETKVAFVAPLLESYDDGGVPFANPLWQGGLLPHTDTGSVVYDLMGTEPLGSPGVFFPAAGDTLMATLYWDPLVTESDVTVSLWTNGPNDDLITVDDINYWQPPRTLDPNDSLLTQYRDMGANTDNLAPVPVPAAVWLLGSGLLGLVGLRRRAGR